MGINDTINYSFPYAWNQENMSSTPKVNLLLRALIERNYREAQELLNSGATFHAIDNETFRRCLFEFVEDYKLMKFMIDNGFTGIDAYCYPSIFKEDSECIDPAGYLWSLVGRAYVLGKKNVMELLFTNGFKGTKFYWKGNYYFIPRYAMKNDDIGLIQLLLSHGYPKKKLIDSLNYGERDYSKAYMYVMSNPTIQWKSYGLGEIAGEVPVPEKPEFSRFTFKKKKQQLMADYNKSMINYQMEVEAKEKYIKTISKKDLEKYYEDKKAEEEFKKIEDQVFADLLEDLVQEKRQRERQNNTEYKTSNTRSNYGYSTSNNRTSNSYSKSYEEDLRETNRKQFSYVDCSGSYRRWGDDFVDHQGNWCSWGSGFYDYDDNYIRWGGTYKDSSGAYRRWGDDFVDGAGNYVRVP